MQEKDALEIMRDVQGAQIELEKDLNTPSCLGDYAGWILIEPFVREIVVTRPSQRDKIITQIAPYIRVHEMLLRGNDVTMRRAQGILQMFCSVPDVTLSSEAIAFIDHMRTMSEHETQCDYGRGDIAQRFWMYSASVWRDVHEAYIASNHKRNDMQALIVNLKKSRIKQLSQEWLGQWVAQTEAIALLEASYQD